MSSFFALPSTSDPQNGEAIQGYPNENRSVTVMSVNSSGGIGRAVGTPQFFAFHLTALSTRGGIGVALFRSQEHLYYKDPASSNQPGHILHVVQGGTPNDTGLTTGWGMFAVVCNDALHLLFPDASNNVYHTYSSDGATGWSTPQAIGISTQFNVSAVSDGLSIYVVAMGAVASGQSTLVFAVWDGTSWSSAGSTYPAQYNPAIADTSQALYAFYMNPVDSLVHQIESQDGLTWDNDQALSFGTSGSICALPYGGNPNLFFRGLAPDGDNVILYLGSLP